MPVLFSIGMAQEQLCWLKNYFVNPNIPSKIYCFGWKNILHMSLVPFLFFSKAYIFMYKEFFIFSVQWSCLFHSTSCTVSAYEKSQQLSHAKMYNHYGKKQDFTLRIPMRTIRCFDWQMFLFHVSFLFSCVFCFIFECASYAYKVEACILGKGWYFPNQFTWYFRKQWSH